MVGRIGRSWRRIGWLAVAVLAGALPAAPARAQGTLTVDERVGEVSGWTIGYSKGFAGCFATAAFTDNTSIWIGYAPKLEFYIAFTNPGWQSVQRGKTYKLSVNTQGRGRWTGEFLGFERTNEKGVIIPALKEKFLIDFAEAGGITVSIDGRRITGLSLAGSRAALRALLNCQTARAEQSVADAKAAPASPVTPASPTPPPTKPGPSERGGGSGTGFFVTTQGHVLTNHHVAGRCQKIEIAQVGRPAERVKLIAVDQKNDLALLQTEQKPNVVPALRTRIRLGDSIAVYGFPLAGVLASGGNFTLGNVTALAGLADDTSQLQISAPVQPGNSGGPLLDKYGNVVGVIVAKLNVLGVAKYTNDVAQNVNFAIKAATAANFLETNGVTAGGTEATKELEPPDLADRAKTFTVKVLCDGR
jgi:serine protease Do